MKIQGFKRSTFKMAKWNRKIGLFHFCSTLFHQCSTFKIAKWNSIIQTFNICQFPILNSQIPSFLLISPSFPYVIENHPTHRQVGRVYPRALARLTSFPSLSPSRISGNRENKKDGTHAPSISSISHVSSLLLPLNISNHIVNTHGRPFDCFLQLFQLS